MQIHAKQDLLTGRINYLLFAADSFADQRVLTLLTDAMKEHRLINVQLTCDGQEYGEFELGNCRLAENDDGD